MKYLRGILQVVLFLILFFVRYAALANCDFLQAAEPTCDAITANLMWCDTGVDGTTADPVLKGCDGTNW